MNGYLFIFVCLVLFLIIISILAIVNNNKTEKDIASQRDLSTTYKITLYDSFGVMPSQYALDGYFTAPNPRLYNLPLNRYPFIGAHNAASGNKPLLTDTPINVPVPIVGDVVDLVKKSDLGTIAPMLKTQSCTFLDLFYSYVRYFDLKVAILTDQLIQNLDYIKKGIVDKLGLDNSVANAIFGFFRQTIPSIPQLVDVLFFIYDEQNKTNAVVPLLPIRFDLTFLHMIKLALEKKELIFLNFSGYTKDTQDKVKQQVISYFNNNASNRYYIIKSLDDLKRPVSSYLNSNIYIIITFKFDNFTYNNPNINLNCFSHPKSLPLKSNIEAALSFIDVFVNNKPLHKLGGGAYGSSCIADVYGKQYRDMNLTLNELVKKDFVWEDFIIYIKREYNIYLNNFVYGSVDEVNIINGFFERPITDVASAAIAAKECSDSYNNKGWKESLPKCLSVSGVVTGAVGATQFNPLEIEKAADVNNRIFELCAQEKFVPNVILLDNVPNIFTLNKDSMVAKLNTNASTSKLYSQLQKNAIEQCVEGGLLYKVINNIPCSYLDTPGLPIKIEIKTSNDFWSGTDSDIKISFYDPTYKDKNNNNYRPFNLDNPLINDFEKGNTDTFVVWSIGIGLYSLQNKPIKLEVIGNIIDDWKLESLSLYYADQLVKTYKPNLWFNKNLKSIELNNTNYNVVNDTLNLNSKSLGLPIKFIFRTARDDFAGTFSLIKISIYDFVAGKYKIFDINKLGDGMPRNSLKEYVVSSPNIGLDSLLNKPIEISLSNMFGLDAWKIDNIDIYYANQFVKSYKPDFELKRNNKLVLDKDNYGISFLPLPNL